LDIVNIVEDVSALNLFSILKTVFIVIAMPFTVIIWSRIALCVRNCWTGEILHTVPHTALHTLVEIAPGVPPGEPKHVFLGQKQSTVFLFVSYYLVNCSSAFLSRRTTPSQF